MDNKDKRQVLEDLKKSDQFIVLTEGNCAICGDTPTLLTMYVHLTEQMLGCKFVDEEILGHAYKLGISSDEEKSKIMAETIKGELKEQLKKLQDALEEVL